jgi:hypothetical protein
MKDFWLSCGHHLLDRDEGRRLAVTDEFLKAYFVRPELAPPPEACVAERALHSALLADPRHRVGKQDIAAIADPDARENWTLMIDFRDHLLRHSTVESAYLALVRDGPGRIPPMFFNQLVHAILRNALHGCDDAFQLRAAELFFRPQRMTLHEGSLLAADEEKIAGSNPAPVSPLVSMLGLEASTAIDILSDDNAEGYFERSDLFDMALDLTAGRRGQVALGGVIEIWLRHLLAVDSKVEPFIAVKNASFPWYVGLDAEGTRIGDCLWKGEEIDDRQREQVAALYTLRFGDPNVAAEEVGRGPVYLILAMTKDKVLHMKPQNLITGLPLRHLEAVT